MSFLESIEHGLEKASQEAAHLTKIQHLHTVATDLNFRVSQEGQNLGAKTMELYYKGALNQGELIAMCQQMATYQQQLHEVQEEIQRLQNSQEPGAQQGTAVPPAPAGYAAYPSEPPTQPLVYNPGAVPPPYPPYPAPPAGYPAYPAYAAPAVPAGYSQPAYPASSSSETPTKPGKTVPVAEPPTTSSETPTKPGKTVARSAQVTENAEPASSPTAGTYANGTLPPIFSPFANHPASGAPENAAVDQPETEKPAKAHRSAKKAATETENGTEAPAEAKKSQKTAE